MGGIIDYRKGGVNMKGRKTGGAPELGHRVYLLLRRSEKQ